MNKPPSRWMAAVVLCAVASAGLYLFWQPDASESPPIPDQNSGRPEASADRSGLYAPDVAQAYPSGAARPAAEVAAPLASPPTAEQQQLFSRLRDRLHDQAFRRTHTYREFMAVSVPEWESLPLDMKQRLITEMNELYARGEFNPSQFVPEAEVPAATTATPTPTPTPTPATSPPPTAEQRQTYELLRSKLHDPGFTQTRTLNQIAALPELQKLPPELHRQLAREVTQMLNRGELRLRSAAQAGSQQD